MYCRKAERSRLSEQAVSLCLARSERDSRGCKSRLSDVECVSQCKPGEIVRQNSGTGEIGEDISVPNSGRDAVIVTCGLNARGGVSIRSRKQSHFGRSSAVAASAVFCSHRKLPEGTNGQGR